MSEQIQTSSGVQDLISRIRDEGVQAGRQEADGITAAARAEATRLVEEARAEAGEMRRKAEQGIESQRVAAMEALKLAARDAVLKLKQRVSAGFEQYVKRLVIDAVADPEVIKAIVLALAGQAGDGVLKGREIQIEVSKALLTGESSEKLVQRSREVILALSSDMLRDGVELIPASDVSSGARVRLKGEDLEIDLTGETVAALLMESILPRFRRILSGQE